MCAHLSFDLLNLLGITISCLTRRHIISFPTAPILDLVAYVHSCISLDIIKTE